MSKGVVEQHVVGLHWAHHEISAVLGMLKGDVGGVGPHVVAPVVWCVAPDSIQKIFSKLHADVAGVIRVRKTADAAM